MQTIDKLWKKLDKVELIQVRPVEMEAMYKHCFEFEEPFIVEIGSAHGASSIIFAEAAKELNGGVVCIDPFLEDYMGQEKFGEYAFKAFNKNTKEYQRGNVLFHMREKSEEAIKEIRKGAEETGDSIQVLFVDGDHSYEAVKKDCENYLPLLQSGGYVGFHDYNNVAFGVKTAVDEFTQGWEHEDFWDLAVFKKP